MFTSESIRVDNRGATAKEEVKKSLLASPTPSTIESFVRCNDRKTHTHVVKPWIFISAQPHALLGCSCITEPTNHITEQARVSRAA